MCLDRDWDGAVLDEAAAISQHVACCPACRQAMRQVCIVARHFEQPRSQSSRPEQRKSPASPPAMPLNGATPRWGWPAASRFVVDHGGLGMLLARSGRPGEAAGRRAVRCQREIGPLAPPPIGQRRRARTRTWTGADMEREVGVFANVSGDLRGPNELGGDGRPGGRTGPHARAVATPQIAPLATHGVGRRAVAIPHGPGHCSRRERQLGRAVRAWTGIRYYIATTANRDRRLSLSAEVRTPNGDGETLAALATQLRPLPGQSLSVGRLVASSSGYNLEISFQEKDLSGSSHEHHGRRFACRACRRGLLVRRSHGDGPVSMEPTPPPPPRGSLGDCSAATRGWPRGRSSCRPRAGRQRSS